MVHTSLYVAIGTDQSGWRFCKKYYSVWCFGIQYTLLGPPPVQY